MFLAIQNMNALCTIFACHITKGDSGRLFVAGKWVMCKELDGEEANKKAWERQKKGAARNRRMDLHVRKQLVGMWEGIEGSWGKQWRQHVEWKLSERMGGSMESRNDIVPVGQREED